MSAAGYLTREGTRPCKQEDGQHAAHARTHLVHCALQNDLRITLLYSGTDVAQSTQGRPVTTRNSDYEGHIHIFY